VTRHHTLARTLRLPLTLALALASCREQLTQPGECPELCPGGTPEVLEEVLEALPALDSTFTGYADRGSAQVLLVSSGVPTPADTNIAIVVFAPRPDEIRFRDTLRAYTVDSIRLGVGLIARDTAVDNLRFEVYRLPATLDTTSLTYAGVRPLLTAPALVTTIVVPDSALRGPQTVMLRGAEVNPFALAPEDAGRLRIAVTAVAGVPTGARIGQRASLVPASFESFVTPIVDNTTAQEIEVLPEFDTYVSSVDPVPDPDLLTIGGVPSSRSLIRFPFPTQLRDSASIIRATLELVPAVPLLGLPNDPGNIEVRGVSTDVGAKSPRTDDRFFPPALAVAPAGTTAPVGIEVAHLIRGWQGRTGLPPTLSISVGPEAGTFTVGPFGSSRSGVAPRLRVTYLPAFPFEGQ